MSTADPSSLTPEATRAYRRRVDDAAAALRDRVSSVPARAVLLDRAVGALPAPWTARTEWPAREVPHWPDDGESGAAAFALGTLGDVPVLALHGTPALADGHTPRDVAFPIRVLATAGVESFGLVQTVAGLTSEGAMGTPVLLTDHINLSGANPLVGPNVDDWGPRFPDMTAPYAPELRRAAEAAARDHGHPVRGGVYVAVPGPDWGTPAEVRMARRLGGDVAGTGVVPEVIAARHMDRRVLAVGVPTRRLAPTSASQTESADPAPAVDAARPHVARLLEGGLAA